MIPEFTGETLEECEAKARKIAADEYGREPVWVDYEPVPVGEHEWRKRATYRVP